MRTHFLKKRKVYGCIILLKVYTGTNNKAIRCDSQERILRSDFQNTQHWSQMSVRQSDQKAAVFQKNYTAMPFLSEKYLGLGYSEDSLKKMKDYQNICHHDKVLLYQYQLLVVFHCKLETKTYRQS